MQLFLSDIAKTSFVFGADVDRNNQQCTELALWGKFSR
jgi:hypothetical protein